jgi:hypothetical protein
MSAPPLVRITCPFHRGRTIARLERDATGSLVVILSTVHPFREDRKDSHFPVEDVPVELGWARDHMSGAPLETWCPRCRRIHTLEIDWLEQAAATPGTLSCPCGVLN